jgi:hypothetical protein
VNLSAWKVDDATWNAERLSKWMGFLEYIKRDLFDYHDPDAYIDAASSYYFTGTLPVARSGDVADICTDHLFALHPGLDLASAREVLSFIDSRGDGQYGAFAVWYLYPRSFYCLFEAGLLAPSMGGVLIEAFYGASYEEAARLRGFDSKQSAPRVVEDLFRELCSWFGPSEDLEWYPATQLIPFAIGALQTVSLAALGGSDSYVVSLAKHLRNEELLQEFSELALFADEFSRALTESTVEVDIKKIFA